jgi:hypothetical protein
MASRASHYEPDPVPPVSLHQLTRRLGVDAEFRGKRQRDYLQRLVDEEGFPAPFPTLIAGKLRHEVQDKSKWDSEAVDAWFSLRVDAVLGRQIEAGEQRTAAADMDARAHKLGAV